MSTDERVEAAIELRITVNEADPKGISIVYTSVLTISKVAEFYYLQHEFSLENPDPDKMDTFLDSFRDEPYNKKQFLLEETITEFLKKQGYSRLSYSEIEEICLGIPKFRNGGESQMTVGNAIFMDFWDLCGE